MAMKNEVKNVNFKCDVINDADIIKVLNAVPNQTKYIKALIRRDLQLVLKQYHVSQEMMKDGR